MGRAFVYVILGGGVAAGYAALEFTKKGVSHGQLCIISDEQVAPYERPALSKGFLLPKDPARLPGFHTCVGANEERLTENWYKEHGIELILGTRVTSVDVRRKTLLTAIGETITYKFLIIATGARAMKLEEIGIAGSDAENVCYLRDLSDATKLANIMQKCTGGNAIVIGGGYIGMECAASLVINKINVSIVFPGSYCMGRLFTPKIASYYEDFYKSKGVNFIKGTVLSSFVFNSQGKVIGANLKDGHYHPVDIVVAGIGACPNTSLFKGQLTFENRGIKVNSRMQSSNNSVYAVGDVASFPVKLFGDTRRLEHVDAARKSAKQAVSAIMEPKKTSEFNYLPFFYSRVIGANLKDGHYHPVDIVVAGIGACPNTSLFKGQLTFENRGIKVNSQMQSSNNSVYAVGDVASFPVKLFGDTRRLEHVDAARKSAKQAVSAIMEPKKTSEFNYLPFFYSRVIGANLKDGHYHPVDIVVAGIGACPNTSLFKGQLTFENRGIKVNSRMQSSNNSVYAVGDVASFPVKLFGDTRRLEHVDAARKSAKQAVSAIMEPKKTSEFNYLPFFYSRVFSLSWQFYGDNVGEVVHFGDFSGTKFGAYWVNNGRLVGCFLEGGGNEDYEAIANVIRLKPEIVDLSELERKGVNFMVEVSRKPSIGGGGLVLKKHVYLWYATSAIMVASFAYWYACWRP